MPASGSGLNDSTRTAAGTPLAPGGAATFKGLAAGNDLLGKSAQAVDAFGDTGSHEERGVFVEYQINDDGRTRAILHTHQAGTSTEGEPAVASFANTYGQQGYSDEYLYSTRENGALVGDQDTYRTDRDSTLEPRQVHRHVDLTQDLSAR